MSASTVMSTSSSDGMTRRQVTVFLAVLMLSMLLAALGQNGVATALPTIAGKLGGLAQLSWVVTAYLLAMTVATPLYGKLSDLYGPKPLLLIAIASFTVGSLLAGFSQNIGELVAARVVQGVGAGGVITMTFTIGGHVISPRQAGRYQGYSGVVWSLATFAGPPVGGLLTQAASWRWVFFVNVPFGVAAFVATIVLLRLPVTADGTTAPGAGRRQVDYAGAALMVAAAVCVLLVTVWGGQRYSWGSPWVVGPAVAAVVLAVLFVLRERSTPDPVLVLSLLRKPLVGTGLAITFLVGLAMFAASVFLPMYLQVVKGIQPAKAGVFLLPMWGVMTVASFLSGWIIAKTGRYKPFLIAGTGAITLALFLFSRLGADSSRLAIFGVEALMGAGLGVVISKLIMAIQNVSDREDLGATISATQFFRELGGTFGTAIFGAVLAARLDFWGPRLLPASAGGASTGSGASRYADPATIEALRGTQPTLYHGLVDMLDRSLHVVYLTAVPLAAAAFLLTWLLPKPQLQDDDAWNS
jgi:EmrB/QacA subfamily drug resistance transporter